MKLHVACAALPPMSKAEYRELKADIQVHGQRNAIVTYKGELLDGRHRERALVELGITPKYVEWQPLHDNDSPALYVCSMNVRRRHLTASQRAILGAEILPKLEAEGLCAIGMPRPSLGSLVYVGGKVLDIDTGLVYDLADLGRL